MSETRNASGDSGVTPRISPKSPSESGLRAETVQHRVRGRLELRSVRYRSSTRWYSGLRPGRWVGRNAQATSVPMSAWSSVDRGHGTLHGARTGAAGRRRGRGRRASVSASSATMTSSPSQPGSRKGVRHCPRRPGGRAPVHQVLGHQAAPPSASSGENAHRTARLMTSAPGRRASDRAPRSSWQAASSADSRAGRPTRATARIATSMNSRSEQGRRRVGRARAAPLPGRPARPCPVRPEVVDQAVEAGKPRSLGPHMSVRNRPVSTVAVACRQLKGREEDLLVRVGQGDRGGWPERLALLLLQEHSPGSMTRWCRASCRGWHSSSSPAIRRAGARSFSSPLARRPGPCPAGTVPLSRSRMCSRAPSSRSGTPSPTRLPPPAGPGGSA